MSTPPVLTLRTATADFPFGCAVLAALAANFFVATGHDQQRCIQIAVLGLAMAWILARGVAGQAVSLLSARAARVCLAFLALGACATIGVFSPRHAMAEWSMFALFGLSTLVVGAETAVLDAHGRYRFLQLLAGVCGLYTLRMLLAYAAAIANGVPFDFQLLTLGFSTGRFFNHTQTALLPMIVLLATLTPRSARLHQAALLLAGFWWAVLLFSEARASLLALATGIGVVAVLRRGDAIGFLKPMAASLVIGIVLYLVLFIAVPLATGSLGHFGTVGNMVARSVADPGSGRRALWIEACRLIIAHPLLGVGPQHFAHAGARLLSGAHPHDWILQIASEWGIPAVLCLFTLLAMGMRGLLRAGAALDPVDLQRQSTCSALVMAVTGIVVDSLFSGVLVMPQSQLALVLVFGFGLGWTRSLGRPLRATSSAVAGRVATLTGVVALSALVAATAPDAIRKWEGRPWTALEQQTNFSPWPRLWEAGHF